MDASLHFIIVYSLLLLTTTQIFQVSSFSVSMSGNKNHVVVVDSANQDLTSYTATLPVLGETVTGQSFETGCGGKGANQANAAASLGLSPVTMVCRTADDVFGAALLENFRRKGVQVDEKTTVLSAEKTSTGVATIVVDTKSGDNMIIVTPGANHELKPKDVREALTSMKDTPAVVIAQLEILPESSLEALKVAKELGATTVFNPAPASADLNLEEFFPYTDILIPNESELRTLCGENEDDKSCDEEALAKSLFKKGVGKAVIVTLGARGAMLVEKETTTFVAAPDDLPCKNDPVEDTVGAGDAFCGSLSTYMSAGVDMKEAAKLACGFAGMSVRRRGANYPSPDELPDCLLVEAHKIVKA
jgi:ribokinase